MQHLEGADWTFLAIARYNSWDDFAKGEKNSVAKQQRRTAHGTVCVITPIFTPTRSPIA